MPYSYRGLDHHIVSDADQIQPQVIFDVGVGVGKIGSLLKAPGRTIVGFEVFPQYITNLVRPFYSDIRIQDFVEFANTEFDWSADLIVFGDVIEHFSHSEAIDVLETCNYRCKYIAIQTPLSYLQNSMEGNKHEAHRCVIGLQDLMRYNIVHYVKDESVNIIYCLIKGLV